MNTWDPLAKTSEQKVLSQDEQVDCFFLPPICGKFLPGSLGLGFSCGFGFGRVVWICGSLIDNETSIFSIILSDIRIYGAFVSRMIPVTVRSMAMVISATLSCRPQ